MKKYIRLALGVAILGGISSLWLLLQSNADDPNTKPDHKVFLPFVTTDKGIPDAASITVQTIQIAQGNAGGGRIDAFTFLVPYAATAMAAQFDVGSTDNNITSTLSIETIISIAVNRDGAVIYYDQWEDTLEADLTLPTQTSTLVWGDGDPSNNNTGLAAGVQVQGLPANDILTSGSVITLRNTVPTVGRGTPPAIYFDGGDMLTSVGGAIAASATFWTAPPGPGILFTDAWELYPTNRWGRNYISPLGQNVNRLGPPDPNGPGNLGEFEVVGLNVQAVENDTLVEIDLNADGIFTNDGVIDPLPTSLDQGEQLSLLSGVLAGTRVRASAPVQAHLFASDPDSRYEARGYTLVPFEQWTNDYLAPRASDGDFWLYNPNPNPLVVAVQSITNTTTLTVPPNGAVRYPATAPPFDDNNTDDVDMLGATGLRFTSTGPVFYGTGSLDSSDEQDWGYDVLPVANLTSQTLVGLGLGNVNSPGCPQPPVFHPTNNNGRESRIYVTALSPTNLFVDLNNDGITDTVDITGDGIADPYPYVLSPLQEMSITDPTDCDMTGAFIYTEDQTPFAAVWGQHESANPALPSIDAGTGITPLPPLTLQKTFTFTDTDCTGTVNRNDIVEFKLQYFNNSVKSIGNVVISDTLSSAVAYVSHTTRLNGNQIPDGGGSTPFPLDEGGYNIGNIPSRETGFLTFDVIILDDSNPIINQAEIFSQMLPLGSSDQVEIKVHNEPAVPVMQISKTFLNPAIGSVTSGQVITFGLTITNVSTATLTTLPLQDTFNQNHLSFLSANLAPDLTATGAVTWTDLTIPFGDLAPGAVISITAAFQVGQIPPDLPDTLNVATVVEAHHNNTPAPLTCSASAAVTFFKPEPGLQVKKYTNGFDADNPNNDPVPQIKPGDPVTWDYVVTNIGNVPLFNVTLVDDQLALPGLSPTFVGGDADNDGQLDLDETWRYQATGVAEDLPHSNRPRSRCGPGGFEAPIYTNMAIATGQFGPTTVMDDDPSHYCPPPPSSSPPSPPSTLPPPPPPSTPPPSIPPAVGQIAPSPVLPVLLLPETGLKEAPPLNRAIIFWFITLAGVSMIILYGWSRG